MTDYHHPNTTIPGYNMVHTIIQLRLVSLHYMCILSMVRTFGSKSGVNWVTSSSEIPSTCNRAWRQVMAAVRMAAEVLTKNIRHEYNCILCGWIKGPTPSNTRPAVHSMQKQEVQLKATYLSPQTSLFYCYFGVWETFLRPVVEIVICWDSEIVAPAKLVFAWTVLCHFVADSLYYK